MRTFFAGIAVAVAALVAGAWISIVTGLVPIAADARPPAIERWAARTALIAGVERRMVRGKNPAQGNAAVLDGIHLYQADCQICHGGAIGTRSAVAGGLYQPPPQFAKDGAEDIPYAYTAWVIAHGIRLTGMPAFSRTLTTAQIDDVALFLQRMNTLTPGEVLAWRGKPLPAQLASLDGVIGGARNCAYFPSPKVAAHHFYSEGSVTPDGSFLLEQYYNRGISELSVVGFDSAKHRFVRTKLSKDGTADIATSPGPLSSAWKWTSVAGAQPGATTTIAARDDGSYAFRASNAPGSGMCGAPARLPRG
jgi:mono/diheme cytochrome c family protein